MLKLILIFLLTYISLFNCEYKGVPNERIFNLENEKELNEFDAGVEDEFFIRIHGNPTTGYSWFLKENSDKENLLALNLNEYNSSEDYETDAHPDGMVGVGGDYFFRFKGAKEGSYNLMFVKKRPWEQNNIAEKYVRLNIKSK